MTDTLYLGIDDPDWMTPEARLNEVAAIFAQACMHLTGVRTSRVSRSRLFTEKRLDVSRTPAPPLGRESNHGSMEVAE